MIYLLILFIPAAVVGCSYFFSSLGELDELEFEPNEKIWLKTKIIGLTTAILSILSILWVLWALN